MDDTEDLRFDPGPWAALAALVEAEEAARRRKGPGFLTQTEIQEATGLSAVWARRARVLLETWGLAQTEERFDGRVRYRIARPTEYGRRAHKLRLETEALLREARAKARPPIDD